MRSKIKINNQQYNHIKEYSKRNYFKFWNFFEYKNENTNLVNRLNKI